MTIAISVGTPADAAALAEFAARTFAEAFGSNNRPEDMAAYLASAYGRRQQGAELADPDIVTLIAKSGARLIGYAQVRRHAPPACVPGELPVELWRFYVDRPWQGRGVAPRLMAAVHAAAHRLTGRTLWLGVWERNGRAMGFYAKCGFRVVGTHPFRLGADEQTDLIMVADVVPPDPA